MRWMFRAVIAAAAAALVTVLVFVACALGMSRLLDGDVL